MATLTVPLLVFEKHESQLVDLVCFSTQKEAESYHEYWQIEEDLLYGFDSVGQEIQFYVEDRLVRMKAADKPADPELLERLLREHLEGIDERSQEPGCALPCLVAIAHERIQIIDRGCLPEVGYFFGGLALELVWRLPKRAGLWFWRTVKNEKGEQQ